MRILVDESLPRRFATRLVGYDVSTVRDRQWLGLSNGVLLRAAATAGFDVVVTADASIRHQQNIGSLGIAVVVITRVRNTVADLIPLVPDVLNALAIIKMGEIIEVTPRRDVIRDRGVNIGLRSAVGAPTNAARSR